MVDIFWFSSEWKFVDAPLTNEKASELSHRSRRGYLARVECMRGKSSTICRLRYLTSQKRAYYVQKRRTSKRCANVSKE